MASPPLSFCLVLLHQRSMADNEVSKLAASLEKFSLKTKILLIIWPAPPKKRSLPEKQTLGVYNRCYNNSTPTLGNCFNSSSSNSNSSSTLPSHTRPKGQKGFMPQMLVIRTRPVPTMVQPWVQPAVKNPVKTFRETSRL